MSTRICGLDPEQTDAVDPEQTDAVGLLAVVVGQDTEADPDREGKWRIARRVAPDRTIWVVDPQARHARKTRSQRRDGYKAHIAAEPETGIITACDITSANVSDGVIGVKMLEDEGQGLEIIADSAYGSGETRAELEKAGHRATIKPRPQTPNHRLGADQFTQDDFVIDHQHGRVTCPAGNTAGRYRGDMVPGARADLCHPPAASLHAPVQLERPKNRHQSQGSCPFREGLLRLSSPESLHHQPNRPQSANTPT